MYIKVLPDLTKIEKSYWFKAEDELQRKIDIGSIVKVNLHNRKIKGWVIDIAQTNKALLDDGLNLEIINNLKNVEELFGSGPPKHLISFCYELARHYLCSPVIFLRYCSPKNKLKQQMLANEPTAQENFKSQLFLVEPRSDRRQYVLNAIAQHGSTLIISPDSHSKFVDWLKSNQFNAIKYSHDTKSSDSYINSSYKNIVVVGGRSALFAPIDNLQSIIVLDDSFEQLQEERSPKFRAIDIAKLMSKKYSIHLTVISCVPSVSTHDIEIIDKRVDNNWPNIYIEDKTKLDPAFGLFSPKITSSIHAAIDNKTNAAIIINNKSISKLLICAKCSEVARCEHCDHKVENSSDNIFECTHCKTLRPCICINCKSTQFKRYSKGIKSIASECEKLFQNANVYEITKDSKLDNSISVGSNIFVGSEALLHNKDTIKNLELIIFPDFDTLLFRPSINAFESSLVLLSRAMRVVKIKRNEPSIIISTNSYTSQLINDIQKKDFVSQQKRDLELRKELRLFPFFANAELTCENAHVDKLLIKLNENIVSGTAKGESTKIFLVDQDHTKLADKCYETIRAYASNNKCLISIDNFD